MAYTPEQRRIIALSNALSRGYSPRVREALLEAEAVESSFRNLNYGDRDSRGVLQQRPSTGWGPPGNAAADIRQFLQRAGQLDRGFRGSPGQLAQAIQRSAFPGRYDQHAGEASALLGGAPIAGASAGPSSPAAGALGPASPSPGARSAVLSALLQIHGPRSNISPLLMALHQAGQGGVSSAPSPPLSRTVGGQTSAGPSPRGGSSLSFLEPIGQRFGLSVTSTTGGKHVPGSYHYQGRAVDFAGDPARMMRLMQYALAHPGQFTEAFYDPAGMYVKNGRVYRGSIGGHRDHVHLAR